MEAYAGRAAMETRARREVKRGKRTVLFEIMEQRGRDRLTSGVWERALQKGDPLATRLLDRAVRALGTGVASALNVLDVEAVVIGGGLGVRLGPTYLERLTAEIMTHLFSPLPLTSGSPSWVTWAVRSEPRCSRNRLPEAEKRAASQINFARSFVLMLFCGAANGCRLGKG